MVNPVNDSSKLAIDVKQMAELRQASRQNSPDALKETAKQFESLFMNMVMKSMREATPQDGMFDSQQSKMYTSMLDQQVSQNLAKRGVGLADMLVRQLSNQVKPVDASPSQDVESAMSEAGHVVPNKPFAFSLPSASAPRVAGVRERVAEVSSAAVAGAVGPGVAMPGAATPGVAVQRTGSRSAHVREFQDRLQSHAEEASRSTGIPAKFMLGQAALESGWGRREIKAADGTASHNLFGIKATSGWKGKVVEIPTTEYVNGRPQTRMEKFRAYDSYAEGFQDYARLLTTNPRYEKVIANAQDASGFAQGLQRAGYATDPNYAAKLTRIIKQSLSA